VWKYTDRRHPNRRLYTYVEYGQQLDIGCGYDLQYYLSHYRDGRSWPRCQENQPYIDNSILNVRVGVDGDDEWNSGIVDATDLGEPRVVEEWTYPNSSYEMGYTLQDALDTIDEDFRNNYPRGWNYNVHVLTCL
jgi:hypothetical protein